MNRLIYLLRGLIFLIMGGMVSGCPTGFEFTKKNTSLPSQLTKNPSLINHIFLEGDYSTKSLHFILDNEHVMVIQGARGAFFIDLKSEHVLHSYPFEGVEFSEISSEHIFHQDQYLLLQGRGAANLWEVASGKLLQSWRDPDTNAKATAVSQSGEIIFTVHYLRQLQNEKSQWGKGEFRTIPLANAHAVLSAAAISPNENFLATGGTWDNRVILWDIRSGKDVTSWRMEQHVRTLSFSADNRYLYAGTYTKFVVYDMATKTKVFEIPHPFNSRGAEYLEKHNAMLMVSDDGEIQLGDAPTGKPLWHYQAGQPVEDWNHSPQGDLAVRLSNGEIVVLDLASGQVRLRFQSPFKVMGPLDVSKDGKFLAVMVVSERGWEVVLWQLPEKGSLGENKEDAGASTP